MKKGIIEKMTPFVPQYQNVIVMVAKKVKRKN